LSSSIASVENFEEKPTQSSAQRRNSSTAARGSFTEVGGQKILQDQGPSMLNKSPPKHRSAGPATPDSDNGDPDDPKFSDETIPAKRRRFRERTDFSDVKDLQSEVKKKAPLLTAGWPPELESLKNT